MEMSLGVGNRSRGLCKSQGSDMALPGPHSSPEPRLVAGIELIYHPQCVTSVAPTPTPLRREGVVIPDTVMESRIPDESSLAVQSHRKRQDGISTRALYCPPPHRRLASVLYFMSYPP